MLLLVEVPVESELSTHDNNTTDLGAYATTDFSFNNFALYLQRPVTSVTCGGCHITPGLKFWAYMGPLTVNCNCSCWLHKSFWHSCRCSTHLYRFGFTKPNAELSCHPVNTSAGKNLANFICMSPFFNLVILSSKVCTALSASWIIAGWYSADFTCSIPLSLRNSKILCALELDWIHIDLTLQQRCEIKCRAHHRSRPHYRINSFLLHEISTW